MIAPLLRSDIIRMLPSRPAGRGDLHLQRRPRGARRIAERDRVGQGRLAPGECRY